MIRSITPILNGYAVGIVDVKTDYPMDIQVTRDGGCYVVGEHEQQYGIRLFNRTNVNGNGTRAQADVYIDGKHVGSWIVPAVNTPVTIFRPAHEDRAFHILQTGTEEARGVLDNVSRQDMGLIRVVFSPEKKRHFPTSVNWEIGPPKGLPTTRGGTLSAAGTGLGDATGQRFGQVDFEADKSEQTIVMLRLTVEKQRKYGAVSSSTPYPKPID